MSGIQTYFEQRGDKTKTPLVFVHAFPLNSGMWDFQFADLSKDHHVIRYDVRGFGKSKTEDSQVTIELFTEDLRTLLDDLKIKRATLCGLSMGGYISLRFAEKYPERIESLILANTRSEGDTSEGRIKRAEGVALIKSKGLDPYLDAFMPSAVKNLQLHSEKIRKWAKECPVSAVTGALIAFAGRSDTTAALPKFKFPALVIVGEEDTITPPSCSESMAKAIPNAQLVKLKDAAHLSNLDQPEAFTAAIRKFLK